MSVRSPSSVTLSQRLGLRVTSEVSLLTSLAQPLRGQLESSH